MNLAIGAGLLTATVLLYSWAYGVFRNEKSSFRLTKTGETVAVATCVTLTGLIALTLAFVLSAGIQYRETIAELTAVHLGVIAVSAALCWFLPRRIMAQTRAGNDSPDGEAPEGSVSAFPGGGRGKKKAAGSRSATHRKAA